MSIGELIHCDLKNYPNVQRWLGNVKKQPNYEKVNEVFNGFRASTQGKPGRRSDHKERTHDQGSASQRLSLPRFGGDSQVLRGLPRPAAGQRLQDRHHHDRPQDRRRRAHSFFQLDDGSCLAFFEAPDMPFDFKEQHDFDLHIALEVLPDHLRQMYAKGKAEGREVRGISDHKFIDSIYFRDPNGYVIELTAKKAGHEAAMDPAKSRAREILNGWQASKRPTKTTAVAAS
jgi:catechol 2,3-dioxygenase-like lactoylglutathione lyase family enzyme